MRFVLFQPQISGNLGAVIRSCACFDLGLEIIEPCGFPLTQKALRRAAMDYGRAQDIIRHTDWHAFASTLEGQRLVLMTTKGAKPLTALEFTAADVILFGNESSGAPDHVHTRADARAFIPQAVGTRSLNLSNAVAVTAFHALAQSGGLENLISPAMAAS